MTLDELIAEAKKHAKGFENIKEDGIVTLEMAPKVRVVEAVAVYFESDEHDGRIEVFLERETGKCLSALSTPKKPEKKVWLVMKLTPSMAQQTNYFVYRQNVKQA